MADDNLNAPVTTQATRIDATLLPKVFSQPYMLYVVQQGADLGNVANKANEAGQGAYDAQVKNDEQDDALSNHESRIEAAEQELVNHEQRITQAEKELADHEQRIKAAEAELVDHGKRIAANETKLSDHEERIAQNTTDLATLTDAQKADSEAISNLQSDYLSKSSKSLQSISGALNVSASLSVNGVKVVGAQQTGWTAATGTANKSAFNADQSYTVGAAYSQTEVLAIIKALVETRQRVKGLEDMARAHGLIK